jgi:pyrroloquinoline quinone biosynthesis protein B
MRRSYLISAWTAIVISACSRIPDTAGTPRSPDAPSVSCTILGVAQDGGHPQAGCDKACCRDAWKSPSKGHRRTCLSVADHRAGKVFLFEATPDLPSQLKDACAAIANKKMVDGVFLTHAHTGHYSGLMHFGRETMNTRDLDVFVMPGMQEFLATNGPWSQLAMLENIRLIRLNDDIPLKLTDQVSVTPILVPHRDEYSETVGYLIEGPSRKLLFIPDIDKWERWPRKLAPELRKVDVALIDGTFYDGTELPGRNLAEIPHPFVRETMDLLDSLPPKERAKVRFIHFNHTNPLLLPESEARREVKRRGFSAVTEGEILGL